MELWIPITIAAAFVQNLRSGLQRHLRTKMGTTGATFVRFGFGLPVAFALFGLALWLTGTSMPPPNASFWLWVAIGAFAQIAGQALLVVMFTRRSFAVGSAYSRTEPIQAVIFGLVLLSERAPPSVLVAIAISVSGVIVLTLARQPVAELARRKTPLALLASSTALIGLASGAFFGLSAVAYRAASLSLAGPNFMVQAGMTLCVAITLQTAVILAWMVVRDRAELRRIVDAWRIGALTGLAGALASFGWFSAMTLQQAGAVKALAQIEMLFAYATTVLIFREPINRAEIAGCALVAAGVIVLVLA